ncbi:hypothetical protein ACFQV8_23960 [Pseudonocardia benzenivorans]
MGVRPGSVYQSFAPFFTSTGSHTNLLGCLAAGCTYVVEPEFDAHATLDRMQRHRTTSVFLISSVLALILDRRTPPSSTPTTSPRSSASATAASRAARPSTGASDQRSASAGAWSW